MYTINSRADVVSAFKARALSRLRDWRLQLGHMARDMARSFYRVIYSTLSLSLSLSLYIYIYYVVMVLCSTCYVLYIICYVACGMYYI